MGFPSRPWKTKVGVGSHISLKVGFIIRFFYRAVLMNASSVTLMFCLSSDRFIAISDVLFLTRTLENETCHCNMWNHTKPKPVPRSVPPGSFHYHLFPACFEVWFELVVTLNMLNQDQGMTWIKPQLYLLDFPFRAYLERCTLSVPRTGYAYQHNHVKLLLLSYMIGNKFIIKNRT